MLPGEVCLPAHHRMQMVSSRLRGHMLGLGGGALYFIMMKLEWLQKYYWCIFPPLWGASTMRWHLAHDPVWKACLRPWSFKIQVQADVCPTLLSQHSKAQVVSYNLHKQRGGGSQEWWVAPPAGGRPRTLSKHRYPQQRMALLVPETSAGPWVKSEYISEASR